jgi:hypothetical protein
MSNYHITPEQVASVTDLEVAFGTARLLPSKADIPKEFWDGNIYTKLASAIFYNRALPAGSVMFHDGYAKDDVVKAVRAHLSSFEPDHDHKIAGVGYMMSCVSLIAY